MSRASNSRKLALQQAAGGSTMELPVIELESTNTDVDIEKGKEDAKEPLYIKRV
jgi:hypothetical protein